MRGCNCKADVRRRTTRLLSEAFVLFKLRVCLRNIGKTEKVEKKRKKGPLILEGQTDESSLVAELVKVL